MLYENVFIYFLFFLVFVRMCFSNKGFEFCGVLIYELRLCPNAGTNLGFQVRGQKYKQKKNNSIKFK